MYAITVALPMYRCRSIGWLALESLCRQVDIDFEWELIIMEEAGVNAGILGFDPMGRGTIMAYKARLKEVGCTSIQYVPLKEWLPLSEKWVQMGRLAQSEDFLLLGADDYAPPNRLSLTRKALKDGSQWAQSQVSPFYDIFSETLCIYKTIEALEERTAMNMAVKTSLIKRFNTGQTAKFHVDHTLFTLAKDLSFSFRVKHIDGIAWQKGVCTTGLNQISGRRSYQMQNYVKPYYRPSGTDPKKLSDCLPADVANKLRALKDTETTTVDFIGGKKPDSRKPSDDQKKATTTQKGSISKPASGWASTMIRSYSKRKHRPK